MVSSLTARCQYPSVYSDMSWVIHAEYSVFKNSGSRANGRDVTSIDKRPGVMQQGFLFLKNVGNKDQ